ncbi:hypothetical protein [Hymenobacter cheonanensis]|uniref:hypothetical protein n=1 Tax=Hymenobacter sp. CA2-7 TaxID=3063993 RepID=UPI00271398DC|nr:hypothetical protein [Hymenobacter sp. CA2-7]MDO7888251.1 hypothetical protein [Hymenobacter sp. CA2-7]
MNRTARVKYFTQLTDVYEHVAIKKAGEILIDDAFTESALELLDLKSIGIDEISQYCIDEHDAIVRAFQYFDSKEIRQPVSLLLFYYIEYYGNFIEMNWPFSNKLFRDYKLALGLSDNY